jgi:signal transduction histidine kinase
MRADWILEWATLAVSLFNTILLLWLGFTVLLNAERRNLGIWLAGGGLLLGGAFFLSHSIILGHGLDYFGRGVNFWWHLGWIPVVLAPFAWYLVMLWYAGFWEEHVSPTRSRHRGWFMLLIGMTVCMTYLLVFANPLPSFTQAAQLNLNATPSVLGVPILILFYPLYILLCTGLSLDALRRPGPTLRVMGHLARQRARPWLIAASIVLLLVSLLVGAVMMWIVLNARLYAYDFYMARTVVAFDLTISLLIAISVTLTGQAVVSYEVFTGKTLPRRGLQRYWQRAFILALGYSSVLSLSLVLGLHPIYSLLLSACLMVIFYALLSWRSYAERERQIASLRPFVASQQLYEQLLVSPSEPGQGDAQSAFRALCADVLGARLAYLAPLGSFAPLFGETLAYGEAASDQAQAPPIPSNIGPPGALCIPLESRHHAGAVWGVPLWNERGLVGLLMLGEKRDGGLYTQEEIEFARAASERLMDIQVSAEMARRLMALQRRQIAETQILDRRARRVLHDDVLPRLHAAMLGLNQACVQEASPNPLDLLAQVHHDLADLLGHIPAPTPPELVHNDLISALRQALDGDFRGAFDRVSWQVTPEAARMVARIPPLVAEVLFYATLEVIRNAARHARGDLTGERAGKTENDQLNLQITIDWKDGLVVAIQDNGVGIQGNRPPTKNGGRGLSLHSTLLAVIGASLSIDSAPGEFTRVEINLPASSVALAEQQWNNNIS